MDNKVDVTCVYCGHLYPEQTPTSGADILKDHIKICDKHPMREAEQTIDLLRGALVGLVGSDDKAELEKMELIMKSTAMLDDDRENTINAIHAIVKTAHRGMDEN